jgi:uncharacterized protein (TIGR03086 family)
VTADLRPAADRLTAIIRIVPGDRLTAPTPCEGVTVGELLDHIDSLSFAFAAAARKIPLEGGGRPPVPDASRLGSDWRDRIPARLAELAEAWREPSAWTGTAEIGGGVLPAEVAGTSALGEIIVHGWDLAVATGAAYPGDDPALTEAVRRVHQWVGAVAAEHPGGSPGLFGPPVPVPGDAPLLDRLLGLTGRDPGWKSR